jgi:hypothetical protein
MSIEVTRFRGRGPEPAEVLAQPDTSGACAITCYMLCTSACKGIYALAAATIVGTVAGYAYSTSDFGNEEL